MSDTGHGIAAGPRQAHLKAPMCPSAAPGPACSLTQSCCLLPRGVHGRRSSLVQGMPALGSFQLNAILEQSFPTRTRAAFRGARTRPQPTLLTATPRVWVSQA